MTLRDAWYAESADDAVNQSLEALRTGRDLWGPVELISATQPAHLHRARAVMPSSFKYVDGRWRARHREVTGSGTAFNDQGLAVLAAVVEAAERYAFYLSRPEVLLLASANELGPACLDWRRLPCCSATELSDPRCPVAPFDPKRPRRWLPCLDLGTGQQTLVPASLIFTGRSGYQAHERIALSISTGCAAHTDRDQAIINGALEVCERDSIALTWEQMLPLRELDDNVVSPEARDTIEWLRTRFVDVRLFDATTDAEIATIYAVLSSEYNDTVAQSVSCASGNTLPHATTRVMKESVALRVAIERAAEAGHKDPSAFTEVTDGAVYMGRRELRSGFDFLLAPDAAVARRLSKDVESPTWSEVTSLGELAGRLTGLGLSVLVAEVTPRELADLGLHVVKVIIPELQPMSLSPLARYRGHPRLYSAPEAMGFRPLDEVSLNPHPQPFA